MPPDGQQPIVIHPPVHGEIESDAPAAVPATSETRTLTSAPTAVMLPLDVLPPPPAASSAPEARTAVAPKRAFSLDALRGLFLISMTLGFTIRGVDLPLWMYHRQMPPPDFGLENVAGISWRDLAYGAFLFTMAAALPLTLSRRVDKGETELGIVFAAIRRFVVLLFFALLVAHSNTYFLGYAQPTRVLAIAGFGVMALVFTRRRDDWDENRYRVLNRAGWALAVLFLALSPLVYGATFSFERIDDIIVGLAFASLTGSVIWYFTRGNLAARIGVLGVAAALYLGARNDGWVQQWWYSSPIPWALEPSMLVLLTIVIPGTIAGDVVLRWMRAAESEASPGWGRGRVFALGALAAALTPIVVVGMYNRAALLTTQLALAVVIAGAFLTSRPSNATERMLRSLFAWGAIWLTIGLFLEPFEGGIKKVPDTLSYYFTVAGTTTMLLVTLAVLTDAMGRAKWVSPLIDVGHNPLLAYVLFTVLINSALELIPPLRGVLRNSTGEGLLRSVMEVTAVVLIVRAASHRRIYWRT